MSLGSAYEDPEQWWYRVVATVRREPDPNGQPYRPSEDVVVYEGAVPQLASRALDVAIADREVVFAKFLRCKRAYTTADRVHVVWQNAPEPGAEWETLQSLNFSYRRA